MKRFFVLTLLATLIWCGTRSDAQTFVRYSQIGFVPTATVLGRNTAGTGAAEALSTLPSAVQLNITQLGTLTTLVRSNQANASAFFRGASNSGANVVFAVTSDASGNGQLNLSTAAGATSVTMLAGTGTTLLDPATITDGRALPAASDYSSLIFNGAFTGAGSPGGLVALAIEPTFSGATATGSFAGPYSQLNITGSGAITRLMGSVARLGMNGTNTVSEAYGFYGSAMEGSGTGTTNYAANFWSRPTNFTGALTLGQGFGLRVDALSNGSATVSGFYGAAIALPTTASSNNIGLYIGDADTTPFGGATSVSGVTASLYVQTGTTYFGGATTIAGVLGVTSTGASSVLGNFGVGTSSPNIIGFSSNAGVLTVKGKADATNGNGVLELATASTTEATGRLVGQFAFVYPLNTGGSGEKRIGLLEGSTSGSTANDRGGQFIFYTKQNGGGLDYAHVFTERQNTLIGTTTQPSAGTRGEFFADGTAPVTLGASTAGIYADVAGGDTHMFAISQSGKTMQLTGAANNTLATAVQDNITRLGVIATVVQLTDKITKYNNITTAGNGVPAIYGSGRSTAQTAAVASVAAYTVGAADASFDVAANVNVTTSTSHSFSVQVDYTDETNTAQTLTLSFLQLTGTTVTTITNGTGAGPYEGTPARIRCKASTSITIKTTGTFTTVTYNVEGSIVKIA